MTRIYIIIIFTIILFSCSRDSYSPDESSNLVKFSCIKTKTATKAGSFFPNGNIATIHAYSQGKIEGSVGGTPTYATASVNGILTTESCIYLPKGYYDFYSVSENSSYVPDILFCNGLYGNLENFVDYLWAGNKNFHVDNGAYVTFEYQHMACQIQIKIESNDRVNGIEINSVMLTLPAKEGVKMDLTSGFIRSSEYVYAMSTLPGYGNSRNLICLPCNSPLQIEVNINACIDNQNVTNKSYGTTISQPLVGGKSYEIILMINPDNSISSTCNIVDWLTVINNISY